MQPKATHCNWQPGILHPKTLTLNMPSPMPQKLQKEAVYATSLVVHDVACRGLANSVGLNIALRVRLLRLKDLEAPG